jgi:hypothetical protein
MIKVRRTSLSSDRHLVNIHGRLSSGWAGRFTGGLAECGLNIERGEASRDARGFWTAGFEVRTSASSLDPAGIDFTGLVNAPEPPTALKAIQLHRYSLTRPPGETRLILEVEAPDQIGFLAQLLSRLAFFSLFPVEMRIETSSAVVRDTVHLSSVAGSAPSEDAVAALRRDLDRLLIVSAVGSS